MISSASLDESSVEATESSPCSSHSSGNSQLKSIHGGMNTEAKIVLDDFNLYDLDINQWIRVKVMLNGQVIESDAKYGTGECYDEEVQKKRD